MLDNENILERKTLNQKLKEVIDLGKRRANNIEKYISDSMRLNFNDEELEEIANSGQGIYYIQSEEERIGNDFFAHFTEPQENDPFFNFEQNQQNEQDHIQKIIFDTLKQIENNEPPAFCKTDEYKRDNYKKDPDSPIKNLSFSGNSVNFY